MILLIPIKVSLNWIASELKVALTESTYPQNDELTF